MDEFKFENYTLPKEIVQAWFCNENYSSKEVLDYLNLTCENYSRKYTFHSTEEIVINNNKEHAQQIAIVASVIFAVGILFNTGLLAILYTQKRFFKPSWCYVCNLIIADLLVLINMLGFIFYLIYPPSNWSLRVKTFIFPSLDIFLSSASMLSVTAIALDRVLMVILQHQQNQRYAKRCSKIVKYVLAGLWLYCACIFILAICRIQVPSNKFYHLLVFWLATTVALIGCVTITLICYVILSILYLRYAVLYNRKSSTKQNGVEQLLNESSIKRAIFGGRGFSLPTATPPTNGKSNNAVKQKYIWKAITICFSSLPFILGWSFYLGVQTYEVIADTILPNPSLNMAMLIVPWIVSALNPAIYICSNKAIRTATFNCLCKFNKKWKSGQKLLPSQQTSVEIV